MKKTLLLITLCSVCFAGYTQIIADHTVVDQFDKIPQQYINEVKKMWLVIAGESHSQAYRTGLTLLADQHPAFAVSVRESGTPEGTTSARLRASRATWGDVNRSSGWIYDYGEEDWFTSPAAITRTKASLLYCKNAGLGLSVFGFGWCYDATYPGVDGGYDPVYGTRWGGATVGSPQGEKAWGLDEGDRELTGNSVSMQTYIDATNAYSDYCVSNNIPTKIIFTTGPVDSDYMAGLNTGELGYQQYLKWEYVRDYVKSDPSAILFDYADILSYNNTGTIATTTWKDRNGIMQTYPLLHLDNARGNKVGHIGSEGAVRLAKAMWWMLARMAGWDDSKSPTGVEDIHSSKELIRKIVNDRELEVLLTDNSKIQNVGLYNLQGIEIVRKSVDSDIMRFDISSLSPGIYLIVLSDGKNRKVEKFIKP